MELWSKKKTKHAFPGFKGHGFDGARCTGTGRAMGGPEPAQACRDVKVPLLTASAL